MLIGAMVVILRQSPTPQPAKNSAEMAEIKRAHWNLGNLHREIRDPIGSINGMHTWIFQGLLWMDDKGCEKTPSIEVEIAPELEDDGAFTWPFLTWPFFWECF